MKRLLILTWMLVAACGCSRSEDPVPMGADQVALQFTLSGISADVVPTSETKASSERLATGTTIRIAAYLRAGADADLTQDKYVTEATYVVQEDGSLVPCAVDANGVSTGTAGATTMYLRQGVYDFYTLTPALPLTDHKEVNVNHGDDYAYSLTPACSIAPGVGTQNVTLTMLERQCSELSFSVTRQFDHITSVDIRSVRLGRIAQAPATAMLCNALPLGANSGEHLLSHETFTQGAEPYQAFGADETLPKSKAPFDLSMEVVFNGAANPTMLQAEIPAMAFDPGLHYNFDISLQGEYIVLTLNVLPWNTVPAWDVPDLGQPPIASVTVGHWKIEEWNTNLGDYFTPVLKPESWVSNGNWDTDLGV